MELRHLNKSDARFLYKLRNDEEVRKNSRNTNPIPYEEHFGWVCGAINNPNLIAMVIWIGNHEDVRAGQLNLKRVSPAVCEVSISLHKEARGKGLAKKALRIAHRVARDAGYTQCIAEVKKCNTASLALFQGQGYEPYLDGELITLIRRL